jgi:inosose dehydratase
LTLDTGHLLVGGADPVALARSAPDRVGHVHLKDVDARLADRVRAGDLSFSAAVGTGLFRPLGEGDVDVLTLVRALEDAGYRGWYVLEQDVQLTGGDDDPDPVANVRASLDHLAPVLA